VIPPEDSSEFVPSEISRAGGYLVIHEENFCRMGISSNVYIANRDGKHYLFDASGDPELISYLSPLGITKESLGAVFLTHGHYDHVRGLLSLPSSLTRQIMRWQRSAWERWAYKAWGQVRHS
jgi:metal-dependent hydrolase (beta-lactamase superfamily II)